MFRNREKETLASIQKTLDSLSDGGKTLPALDRVQTRLDGVQSDLDRVLSRLDGAQADTLDALRQAAARQEDIQKALRRQMNAFEDLADEVHGQSEAEAQLDSRRAEADRREAALVQALALCIKQLHLLEVHLCAAGPEDDGGERQAAWSRQFELLRRERSASFGAAGVQEFGAVGECCDYRLHTVLQTVSPPPQGLEGRIAAVLEPGLMDCGRVVKKAQVAVYAERSQHE
ncbi:MAG: nucleotide exchange factor GrpE [Clostridiales bacterium]|nr:nucleotide exchange factor GrpE [Clostridiales bacterium]